MGAGNEAVQQIAFCDKVLLNKVDLVNDEELAASTARSPSTRSPA